MRLFAPVALALVLVAAAAAAPGPQIRVVSLAHTAVVGVPSRVVVSIRPAAAASLVGRGPSALRARLVATKRNGTYAAALRFPRAGSWTISLAVGGRTIRLGTVAVDLARDPLLLDPFTIAADPHGTLLVGQLQAGDLVRVAPRGRAQKVAAGAGLKDVTVAPNGTLYAVGDDALLRLDGGSLVEVARNLTGATSAAADASGNVYVAEYGGWIVEVAADGTVTPVAGNGREGYDGDGGPALGASLAHPHALALAPDGALLVGDTENRRIRRIDLTTRRISTLAEGVGVVVAIAAAADGTVYAADVSRDDAGGGITATSPSGKVTRVYTGDANGVAVAPEGGVYVNAREKKRILLLEPKTRRTETVARG
jgi:sugar lactone lactonase YvrE